MNLFILILFSSCMKQDTAFYKKVLNDFKDYSYFLALEVKSPHYTGLAVIENDDLYSFFRQTGRVDKVQYQSSMQEKLINKSVIDIGNENLKRWNFISVPNKKIVKKNAAKGVEEFIKIYFDGRVLKDGVNDKERAAIIFKLFEFRIPSKIDDETGYLVISVLPGSSK